MIKLVLAAILLAVLTGCANPVSVKDINEATLYCQPNGGLSRIAVSGKDGPDLIMADCKNGIRIEFDSVAGDRQ